MKNGRNLLINFMFLSVFQMTIRRVARLRALNTVVTSTSASPVCSSATLLDPPHPFFIAPPHVIKSREACFIYIIFKILTLWYFELISQNEECLHENC